MTKLRQAALPLVEVGGAGRVVEAATATGVGGRVVAAAEPQAFQGVDAEEEEG